jgi:hypothetical protein
MWRQNVLLLSFALYLAYSNTALAASSDSNLDEWDEFVPNGDGTISYQVHVRNNGTDRTCCQVEFQWMDTRFSKHTDRQAICVYPGHDEWTGAKAVTGGIGCTTTFPPTNETSTIVCIEGGATFKFKYRVYGCHP